MEMCIRDRNPGEGGQQDLIVPELPEQKVEDVPAVPTVSGNFPYPDGTYYGTAEGYLGDITVAVVIQNQTIQSVEILSNEDDAAYFCLLYTSDECSTKPQSKILHCISGCRPV